MRSIRTFASFWIFPLYFCIMGLNANILKIQNKSEEEPFSSGRELKKFNRSFVYDTKILQNSRIALPQIPQESLILGPLEIRDIHNSTLKNFRFNPELAKEFRNEIFRRNELINEEKNVGVKTLKQRRIQRSPIIDPLTTSILSKRQGLGLTSTSLTPQQQQMLLIQQQQQQQAAAVMLQHHMLTLQNQGQLYNGLNRKHYDYDDDDDSDSEEDDEFDSDEFMSYPIRMGFMPPPPGFSRRRDYY